MVLIIDNHLYYSVLQHALLNIETMLKMSFGSVNVFREGHWSFTVMFFSIKYFEEVLETLSVLFPGDVSAFCYKK